MARVETTPRTARLPRTSPESVGVSRTALDALLGALDRLGGVHSVTVLRHGSVIAEGWWEPYRPDRRHQLFSVSKTFTAMAVGIAVGEGLLTVDDRVVDLLPESLPAQVGDHLAAMRVRHLLTMTTGHATGPMDAGATWIGRADDDWVRGVLAHPVEWEPGSRFLYNTGATYLLSAILTRLTGQRLLDWLTPRLLAPLGITGATWEQCPRGIDVGGYGLSVTTEDLAAFGQCLLQRGRWAGRQLIPADWVEAATSNLADSSVQGWDADWSRGYGYQMWRCQVDAARADGAFGQFVIVWPEHDAVIALTAGLGSAGVAGTQAELDAVWHCLREAFGAPACGAPHAGAGATRSAAGPVTRAGLALALPSGDSAPTAGLAIDGVVHAICADDGSWDGGGGAGPGPGPGAGAGAGEGGGPGTMTVRHTGSGIELRYAHPPAVARAAVDPLGAVHRAAFGRWNHYLAAGPDGEPVPHAAAYAWTGPRTLEVRTYATGTPFGWTSRLRWSDDGETVEVAVDLNVSFDDTAVLRAVARRAT